MDFNSEKNHLSGQIKFQVPKKEVPESFFDRIDDVALCSGSQNKCAMFSNRLFSVSKDLLLPENFAQIQLLKFVSAYFFT